MLTAELPKSGIVNVVEFATVVEADVFTPNISTKTYLNVLRTVSYSTM